MVDQMANHATRVRRLIDRLGVEKVERFIDTALSLDNLIDVHGSFIARPSRAEQGELPDARTVEAGRLPAERSYMDRFINPPEVIARERAERVAALEQQKQRFPRHPERDVLQFLIEHAPLEAWEVEVLGIIRDEAMYFAPQGMTKIMNEGWASYWHSRILTERALRDDEIIDFAEAHAGVMATAPGRLNPYKIGIELWRDIEHRWNRGMFGAEWEACDSLAEREAWDRQTGLGQEKIFEVRRLYNDITFLDEFLTREFVERQRMYAFGYDPKDRQWEITSREFDDVKRTLLDQLTNFGQPVIEVVDANFRNRSELLLRHVFLGEPLRLDAARETLVSLHRVWRRPVHVATVIDGKGTLLGFDGTDHEQRDWDDEDT
jgi:stage V sporulation protein R